MTGREIVAQLGAERRVEEIILRIAGSASLTQDLKDLAQMVYLDMLGYEDAKLVELWESGAINFLIVRIVTLNLRSKTSRFYYAIRVFSARSTDLAAIEHKTEEP